MKISHEDYLERTLETKKAELKELQVVHRINIARYEARRERISADIDSIERQLGQ